MPVTTHADVLHHELMPLTSNGGVVLNPHHQTRTLNGPTKRLRRSNSSGKKHRRDRQEPQAAAEVSSNGPYYSKLSTRLPTEQEEEEVVDVVVEQRKELAANDKKNVDDDAKVGDTMETTTGSENYAVSFPKFQASFV